VACTGEKRDVERFLVGKSQGKKGRDHLEHLGTDGRLIQIDFLVGQKDVDWIDMAYNMDKWLVLVNNSNKLLYFIACRDSVMSSRTMSFSRTPIHRVSFVPGSPLAARSRAVVRSHI